MITTQGKIIDINGKQEWLLFHRLTKKVNPVDFLSLTDSFIQFPDFLFTISFLILILSYAPLWMCFTIPAELYFLGQILINFRFGLLTLKLLRIPMMAFPKFKIFIMLGIFVTSFFYISWWTLLIIPVFFFTSFVSVRLLTSNEKKKYQEQWNWTPENTDIFINNAFLLVYKYYAREFKFSADTEATPDEIENEDWLKPYSFMRVHWGQLESFFNKKAKAYWRVYLHLDKD